MSAPAGSPVFRRPARNAPAEKTFIPYFISYTCFPMNRYRILVVEDDHAIRNGLTDALTVSGYDVLPVKDGYDALNVIHAEDYDLALLDVVLPGASGFDLLRLIREDRATVPILMLTAKGAEADKVRGLKLGADDYVVKPFSLLEVLARIEAVLRRSPERPRTLDRVGLRRDTWIFPAAPWCWERSGLC